MPGGGCLSVGPRWDMIRMEDAGVDVGRGHWVEDAGVDSSGVEALGAGTG